MNIENNLLEVEFLVFSSHKTMTQTILSTLNSNAIQSVHCHNLTDEPVQFLEGEFCEFLLNYQKRHNKNLQIISVFRDPMDRFFSSFFQALSVDVYGWTEQSVEVRLENPRDSVLFKESPDEIGRRFQTYCCKYDGFGESIAVICNQLDVSVGMLNFSENKQIGINDLGCCRLFLFRFDLLQGSIKKSLEAITGIQLNVNLSNTTEHKWYNQKYAEFKQEYKVPSSIIEKIYSSRKTLIELFYPGEYDNILRDKLHKYGLM
jgi:hypothetical protein